MHRVSRLMSRRANEGIVIGDDIHVTVLKVYPDHVRLAISSPRDVPSYWEQTLYIKQVEMADNAQTREPLPVGQTGRWCD